MSEERRFGPLALEDMTPDQRAIAEAILAGPRGGPGGAAGSARLRGPFEAFLRSPGMAEPAQLLGEHVRFRSALPAALNEMAILLTGRRWVAQYEWYAHRRLAEAAGLDPAVIDAIAAGERPEMAPDAAAVFDFATELLDRGEVTDPSWDAVVERWGKQGAMDLIAAVGYYTLVSFTLNVDRYPVPGGATPLGPR
jgi:4-carboxymuconolactone decarboxylase